MDKTSVSTSELKANCSKVVGRVAQQRTPVVITKHGRPVAKLVPVSDEDAPSLFGFARGEVTIHGDIIDPLDVRWEAAE